MRKNDFPEGANIQIGQTHTILGPESSFDGKLTFQGAVRIDGQFSGEVVTDDVLVVGESAKVKAEVHVGSLILNGNFEGNVYAKNAVEIHSPGLLRGNISTPSLTIDRGVIFEGNCKMENLDAQPRTFTKPAKAYSAPNMDKPDKSDASKDSPSSTVTV